MGVISGFGAERTLVLIQAYSQQKAIEIIRCFCVPRSEWITLTSFRLRYVFTFYCLFSKGNPQPFHVPNHIVVEGVLSGRQRAGDRERNQ